MESDSKLRQWLSRTGEKLNEQEWYQQLKAKWEELDPQSRMYLKYGIVGAIALAVVFTMISAAWSVRSLKREVADKAELLGTIQAANEEMRRLRESTPGGASNRGGDDSSPWTPYFESTAGQAGIDRAALSVSPEKPGAATEQAKETLYDLTLKKVNIKQVVRYAFQLENGSRPVKLRNLAIDTKADPAGYMDAVLSVSAFALKQQ